MVKICIICKRKFVKGSGITYHLFPSDSERRSLWIEACKEQSIDIRPTHLICSTHFTSDSFRITREGGPKLLLPKAVPSIFDNALIKNISINQESQDAIENKNHDEVTTEISLTLEPSTTETCIDNQEEVSNVNKQSSKRDFPDEAKGPPFLQQSSKERSLKTIKQNDKRFPNFRMLHFHNLANNRSSKRTLTVWRPSRIGDLTEGHFSTARMRKIHLKLVRKKFAEKQARIKLLQQQNRRLKRKVEDLEKLLHLPAKDISSNKAASQYSILFEIQSI